MKRLALLFGILILAPELCAQFNPNSTGIGLGLPQFGTLESGPADTVNLQNLNEFISIPIASNPGRGLSLNFAVTYNSNFWMDWGAKWAPVSSPILKSGWNMTQVIGQAVYFTESIRRCAVGTTWYDSTNYLGFAYVEPNGTSHGFPINYMYIPPQCPGSGYSGTLEGTADDGSGYFLNGDVRTSMPATDAGGTQFVAGVVKDANGNYISSTVPKSGETDWYDSAGRTALKIITSTSTIQYEYQDTTGTYQTITLNLQNFNIKTNFACSGIVEYSGTANLPVSIVYPNGTQYSFTYETTPGNPGYTTGRVSKVTLPDGGYLEYTYGGSNDGMSCSPVGVDNLTRVVNDGTNSNTSQYSVSPSGSNSVTTETYPLMPYDSAANQTVYTFNSYNQEISRQIYQGSASAGTLLRTINTTWASNYTPASKITVLEDNSTQSEIETMYDNYGNLDVLKEHDFGSGSPGSILRTTNYTYLTTSAYTNLNIVDRVTKKTISDSTGTIQYREDTAYDGTTISPCPTGVVQHDDTNFPCSFTTRGNPTAVTTYTNASAPSGGVTKHSYYDIFGNLVQADADCCQTMSWNFSATTEYSSPDSVVRGSSSGTHLTTSYTYNGYTGQIASITDPNNQVTTFAYDLMRRPTTTTRPDSAQIVVSYDDTHHTTTTAEPIQGSSVIKHTSYLDGLGRSYQLSVFDASNNLYSSTTTKYDGLDRAYNASNPYTSSPQYWTEITFDALGRNLKAILPDGSQATHSYSGASIISTDPVGNQRKYQADGLNRLSITYEPDPTNDNSLTLQTNYAYTVLDQLATLTQGSQTRTFTFDGMGRLTSHALPESGTTSFQYNSYNQISQRTDARGVITMYTYDSMNRPYQISYNVGSTGVAATPTITYSFGTNASQLNNGRVLTLTDGLGTTTYTYDNLGRATQAQYVINGSSYTVGYQYNLTGKVTTLTYPSARAVQRTYDAIGRLASISDSSTTYANSFSYNVAQLPTNFSYGNGVAATIGYSPDRLQEQSIKFAGSSTLFSATYNRTQNGANNGQITGITDAVDSGRSIAYTYDSLGRLSTALTTGDTNYPQWGLSFTYDRYGNRTNQTVTAGTAVANSVAVSATTNHITTSGYSYDSNGNVTNDGNNSLSYDAENRPLTASGSYGSGTYSYGAFGVREVKASGGSTTVSIYDGNRVIAEYTNGTLANEYVYLGNQLIASRLSGTLYYHGFDHQSIRVDLDSSGNVVGQRGHYPFGEDWYSSAMTNRHFTSFERDSESVNDNALHRSYVNRLGRFSAVDPVLGGGASPQRFNLYSYTGNDPVNRWDPSGRDYICFPSFVIEDWDPFDLIGYDPDPFWFPCEDGSGGGEGGGGGGGFCNPDSLEGNSCPPPVPVPPPPPPTPSCSADLHYRPVKWTYGIANHAFWIVADEDSIDWTLEGGPDHGAIFSVLGLSKLDAWWTPLSPPTPPHFAADTPATPTFLRIGGPNVGANVCENVSLMISAAEAFPSGTMRYNPFVGPNSNSVAHALGQKGGFPLVIGPPRTPGWNYPLTW